MLRVVSNSTPIISFIKLERLDILHNLYGEVFIPFAVYQEIEAGKSKGYYQDLAKIDWINIKKIEDKNSLLLFNNLDLGEAEAIVLANELKADLIIIDERLGRYHANRVGLNLIGTIGVLLKAKQKGIIKKIKPFILELKVKDVWFGDDLVKHILHAAGE